MNTYFKINPIDDSILEVIVKNTALLSFNDKTSSATNGKPYLIEAIVTDPTFDANIETRTGPVDLYDGTTATRIYTVTSIPNILDIQKSNGKVAIDGSSEQARLRYITSGSGQSMVYQEKAEEAADYVVANYPVDLTSYPFIQAEINATGKTSTQAADDILSTKSSWIAISASIEEIRLTAKKDIATAIDKPAIDAIVTVTTSTLDAI